MLRFVMHVMIHNIYSCIPTMITWIYNPSMKSLYMLFKMLLACSFILTPLATYDHMHMFGLIMFTYVLHVNSQKTTKLIDIISPRKNLI